MSRTTRHTMCAAVAAALVLSACGGGQDEGGGASPSSSAGSSSAGNSAADTDGLGQAAADAGIDPKNPPKPIASAVVPGQGADGKATELTVDLIDLKRQDDLLILTAAVTPDKASTSRPRAYIMWAGSTWAPQVLDTKNLKVHDVVTSDGGDRVISSTGAVSPAFGPGQTLYLYAVLAAPPQDVTSVTVKLADGAAAVTGVKIR